MDLKEEIRQTMMKPEIAQLWGRPEIVPPPGCHQLLENPRGLPGGLEGLELGFV